MDRTSQTVIGVLLVAAGAVLALALGDTELGWFTGRPLGVVLVVLGVIDLAEAWWGRRSRG